MHSKEQIQLQERAVVGVAVDSHDAVRWRAVAKVEKYHGDWTGEQIAAGLAPAPYEVLEREGNLLMYGGASCLWQALIGNGSATPDLDLTFFDNTNAALGVGDSTTAAAATQNDLVAATNKLRKGMEATYPLHTDAETSGAAAIVFRSVFGSSEANWVWNEWGTFNSVDAGVGRMLNRKVENLGTKTTGTWTLTVTLSLA